MDLTVSSSGILALTSIVTVFVVDSSFKLEVVKRGHLMDGGSSSVKEVVVKLYPNL